MNFREPLFITLASLSLFVLGFYSGKSHYEHHAEPMAIEKHLSDWEMLKLAIIKTESNFDSLAVGKTKDLGIFQITPIYVSEVNRILGEEKYCHADAFNPTKSLEMFSIYQGEKNPTNDLATAISLHNPNGGNAYARKVKRNLAQIKEYEEYRTLIQQ